MVCVDVLKAGSRWCDWPNAMAKINDLCCSLAQTIVILTLHEMLLLEHDRPMVTVLVEILVMLELVVWLCHHARLDVPDIPRQI